MFYHCYIVFETSDYWWSIEKNGKGITLQRSRIFDFVKMKYRRKQRKETQKLLTTFQGKGSVRELLEYLQDAKELDIKYHMLSDNCKHFASRIVDRFTKRSNYRIEYPSQLLNFQMFQYFGRMDTII